MAIPEFDWRTVTFQLINGVTLKGGYAGLRETDPNTRDVELHETILSGDLNEDDVEVTDPYDSPDEPTRADNSCHVVTITGPVVLDGVVITGGHAFDRIAGDENHSSPGMGGGLWLTGEGITIRDCVFKSNFAAEGGGGLYAEHADLLLASCTFYRNVAGSTSTSREGRGGGMMLYGASAVLINCVLSENGGAWGGGIYSSNPPITRGGFPRLRGRFSPKTLALCYPTNTSLLIFEARQHPGMARQTLQMSSVSWHHCLRKHVTKVWVFCSNAAALA